MQILIGIVVNRTNCVLCWLSQQSTRIGAKVDGLSPLNNHSQPMFAFAHPTPIIADHCCTIQVNPCLMFCCFSTGSHDRLLLLGPIFAHFPAFPAVPCQQCLFVAKMQFFRSHSVKTLEKVPLVDGEKPCRKRSCPHLRSCSANGDSKENEPPASTSSNSAAAIQSDFFLDECPAVLQQVLGHKTKGKM